MRKQNIFTRTKISLVVASCLAASSMPAFAADSSQIDEMKQEIKALEQKLEAMQADVQKTQQVQQQTEAKVEETKKAQEETQVKVEKVASTVTNMSESVRGIPTGKGIQVGKVNLQFGGFLASETAYRSRSLQSDIGSPFSQIPFASSVGDNRYNQSEFRGTERQSRISMLATANVDPETVVSGYYELDFLAAPQTANPNQSNSFSPRTRHVYANIDWLDSGFHILAGQTWSLATLNTQGITPRNEYIPLTIDAQYVVGFNWARQWQFRMVKDWDKKYWGALSFENSQTHGVAGVTPTGVTAYGYTLPNVGGSLFDNQNTMSYNKYPDVIAKFAAETDYGHYEIYDLMRNFQSASTTTPATANTWTNAVGAGAIIPIVPKVLDFSISGLVGKGVGRYGTTQLNDATYNALGELNPLSGSSFLAGLTWKADPKWDVYANYGQERINSSTYACAGGTGTCGFGDGVASAATLDGAPGSYLKNVAQSTAGVWWSFYKGGYGAAKLGLQYSHTTLNTFAPVGGGSLSTSDNMFFTSLRYYPF